MRSLSLIAVLFIALILGVFAQSTRSPHGEKLTIGCADCHHPDGWKMVEGRFTFTHKQTGFPLLGQHNALSCKDCHASLVFDEADQSCISCHTDVHQQTTGPDCARCHNEESWLVPDMTALHRLTRFPLTGAHYAADCRDCHQSNSSLLFEPLPVDCFSCHQQDYLNAKVPDHVANNYSTNCVDCHNINAVSWSGAGINHAFFPLQESHNIDCAQCHIQGQPYNSISQECSSCHLTDYQQAVNPNHSSVGFPTQCNECHDLNPGWRPASFSNHDNQFFPVYSGKHKGEWESCTDCHTISNDFSQFSCIGCHEHNQQDMNEEHSDVSGYAYDSRACFECHPSGDGDKVFDHNTTSFPLTGAHNTIICADCHTSGYSGTSTACQSCHRQHYNDAANPSHTQLGLSQDCAECHTTNPDWQPATFAQHDNYFVLRGAHQRIASNCFDCHEGNYVNSPNSCFGCHASAYDQTTNPPHQQAQFSTNCEECHSEQAWTPATFDHDQQYFPIYSANHAGEWQSCAECHTTPENYAIFSCIDCHEHNQPDSESQHAGISGYTYASDACYACHPTGDGDDAFDHNQTTFPLTGAHNTVSCAECHTSGYTGTSTICADCHTTHYNQSVNPNHLALNIPQACADCHSTQPGWSPASFGIHNNYYLLEGAHQFIANDCVQCHNGNYNSTPNTCFGCHEQDYNLTNNPPHASAQFPTECLSCHTQSAWTPSTFNHDALYFPIYSGEHQREWNLCTDCHTNPNNYAVFSCIDCHEHNQADMADEHDDVSGYVWNSNACLECHPNGEGDKKINHRMLREIK